MIDGERRAVATSVVLVALVATSCRTAPSAAEDDARRAAPDAGTACGPSAPCGPEEYCAFTPGLCGKGKRPGTCRPRAAACAAPEQPVCGCDGKVYASERAAHAAGIDLAVMGGCGHAVPDFAACGPHFCDARTSYCEIVLSDVLDPPTDYACKPLPSACIPDAGVARSCDCFPPGTRCLSFCGPIAGPGLQGFHLTCRR